MGAGASSSRNQRKYVKVEIDTFYGQGSDVYYVDDASIFIGCPNNKTVNPETSIATLFHKKSGIAVKQHTFTDRSQAQLLVSRVSSEMGSSSKSKASMFSQTAAQNSSQHFLVPRVEPFSRISGVCKILGDRDCPSREKHTLVVGDFVRIGSVGLVVTEICLSFHEKPAVIQDSQLWYLKPRAYTILSSEDPKGKSMGTAIDASDASTIGSSHGSGTKHTSKFPPRAEYGSDDGSDDECMCREEGTTQTSDENDPEKQNIDDIPLCYACCDDSEQSGDNPLVSACACKGGTRWLHLKCLERILSGTTDSSCVVFRNQHHKPVCKVCRVEYDNHCRLDDLKGNGAPRIVSVAMPSLRPPYICFKVVTDNAHNMSQESIFNSSFVVSFSSLVPPTGGSSSSSSSTSSSSQAPPNSAAESWPLMHDDENPSPQNMSPTSSASSAFNSARTSFLGPQSQKNYRQKLTARKSLVIGRSSDIDVPLNYQTVSGRHAALHLEQGEFKLSDLRSSNGTFVYMREPMPLPPSTAAPIRVRMGRRTLTFSTVNSIPPSEPDSPPPLTTTNTTTESDTAPITTDLMSPVPTLPGAPHTYIVVPVKKPEEESAGLVGNDVGDIAQNSSKDPVDSIAGEEGHIDSSLSLPTLPSLVELMKIERPTLNVHSSSSQGSSQEGSRTRGSRSITNTDGSAISPSSPNLRLRARLEGHPVTTRTREGGVGTSLGDVDRASRFYNEEKNGDSEEEEDRKEGSKDDNSLGKGAGGGGGGGGSGGGDSEAKFSDDDSIKKFAKEGKDCQEEFDDDVVAMQLHLLERNETLPLGSQDKVVTIDQNVAEGKAVDDTSRADHHGSGESFADDASAAADSKDEDDKASSPSNRSADGNSESKASFEVGEGVLRDPLNQKAYTRSTSGEGGADNREETS